MIQWQMLHDNILIKEAEAVSQIGSIALPDSAVRQDPIGTVVDVGTENPLGLAVGDLVMYTPSGGFPTFLGDEEYIVLRPADIVAKGIQLDAASDDTSSMRQTGEAPAVVPETN